MLGFDLSIISSNMIYWTCLFLGLGLMIFSLIFGEIFDMGADTGHSPFSGPVIAAFLSFFGGVGLIGSEVLEMSALGSASIGLVASVMASSVVYFGFYKFLLAQQGGTTFELEEAVGMDAQVFTTIPVDGTGEVVFEGNAGRECRPARSITNVAIPHNSIVRIERVVGSICLVKPVDFSNEAPDPEVKKNNSPETPRETPVV